MDSDLLKLLCALAAFVLPLALSGFIVWRRDPGARRASGRAHWLRRRP